MSGGTGGGAGDCVGGGARDGNDVSTQASTPLRVLVIRHGYYPDDPRVRREVRALASRGHQVDVLCLRDDGQLATESVADASVTRLPVGHRRASAARYLFEYGAFGLAAAWTAATRHIRRPYDAVQVNTMPDALVFAALVPKLMRAPVLLDLHEVMPELYASKFSVPMDHPLPRMLAWIERAAIRFADACLAVSGPCLDRYVARGSSRDKFTVVMNTADPALFAPRPGSAGRSDAIEPTTDKPGPKAGDTVPRVANRSPHLGGPLIVSHGTLVERYGFDVLLDAVAEIPEARLEILGDGEGRGPLERHAASLGLSDRVVFSGRVPLEQVSDRIARADVGVVANRSDEFTDLVVPTKLMEYVAVGIPAVAARTPAIEAYFDDRAVGFFRAGDAGDLARALREVLESESRRLDMVAHAEAMFNAEYGGDLMQQRYADVVELLGARALDLRESRG